MCGLNSSQLRSLEFVKNKLNQLNSLSRIGLLRGLALLKWFVADCHAAFD